MQHSFKNRLAALEQTAIVVWQAATQREAATLAQPARPAYDAVLAGMDTVLTAIAAGQCEAIGGAQIMGVWCYYVRPWHCTPAESDALYPLCNWIMSAFNNVPLDERPRSTSAYAEWIVVNREYIARLVAYGADNEEL